ncbi:MAG: SH3 domain-containing protein [Alphaproteobacteria bacterium]
MAIRFKSHCAVVALVAAYSIPVPSLAQNFLKDLGNAVKKDLGQIIPQNKRQKSGNNSQNNNLGAQILGGVVGAAVGAKLSENFESNEVLGTIIGTAVGVYVGNEISKSMSQKQQDKMAGATVDAFVSGKNQEWTDPDTKSQNTVRILQSNQTDQPVEIMVDRNTMAEVSEIDLIGETYLVLKKSNVRGGPGTSFGKVGGLAAGNRINVVGKVKNEPWFMISRNGVAYGYIYAPLVQRESASIVTQPVEPPEETLDSFEAIVVAASQECRTVEQAVKSAKGETQTETMTACKGGNGWEVKVAAAAPELVVEPLPSQDGVVVNDVTPLSVIPVLPGVEDTAETPLLPVVASATSAASGEENGKLAATYGEFVIVTLVGDGNWCGRHVAVRIDYPQEAFDLFVERNAPPAAVSFAKAAKEQCPDMRSIQFNHNPERQAGEEEFSKADIQWLSAADDFASLTTYKRLEAASPAEQYNQCDTLAAIPNDPRKPLGLSGIPDTEFVASDDAKNACFQAVLLDGDTSRHYAHLGRVLAFQGDFAGAIAAFTKAKDMGNGTAMHYLGTLTAEGWGMIPDLNAARTNWDTAKLFGAGTSFDANAMATSAGVARRN